MNHPTKIIESDNVNTLRVTLTIDLIKPDNTVVSVRNDSDAIYNTATLMTDIVMDNLIAKGTSLELADYGIVLQGIDARATGDMVNDIVADAGAEALATLQAQLIRGEIDAFAFTQSVQKLQAEAAKALRAGKHKFNVVAVDKCASEAA